jgi:hypothetical protein
MKNILIIIAITLLCFTSCKKVDDSELIINSKENDSIIINNNVIDTIIIIITDNADTIINNNWERIESYQNYSKVNDDYWYNYNDTVNHTTTESFYTFYCFDFNYGFLSFDFNNTKPIINDMMNDNEYVYDSINVNNNIITLYSQLYGLFSMSIDKYDNDTMIVSYYYGKPNMTGIMITNYISIKLQRK